MSACRAFAVIFVAAERSALFDWPTLSATAAVSPRGLIRNALQSIFTVDKDGKISRRLMVGALFGDHSIAEGHSNLLVRGTALEALDKSSDTRRELTVPTREKQTDRRPIKCSRRSP